MSDPLVSLISSTFKIYTDVGHFLSFPFLPLWPKPQLPHSCILALASNCLLHFSLFFSFLFFLRFLFIYFQRKGREGEREGEKCAAASCVPPAGDLTCNPGMGPVWESNHRPFGSQTGTQSPEPQQPERSCTKVSQTMSFSGQNLQ